MFESIVMWAKSILHPFKVLMFDQAGDGNNQDGGDGSSQAAPGDAGSGDGSQGADGGGDGGGQGEGGGDDGAGAGGDGDGGDGSQAGAEGGDGGAGNQGGSGPYAGYNTPEELAEAFQRQGQEFTTLRNKTTTTEQNWAKARENLRGAGIIVNRDGTLSVAGQQRPNQPKYQPKFTDQHRGLFDEKVLEAVRFLIGDELHNFRQNLQQESQAQREFVAAKREANNLMVAMFPQLSKGTQDKPNADFNEAFFNLATEIWEQSYRNKPEGELLAAIRAANELGIPQLVVNKAAQQGFQKGQAGRKIVGPTGGQRGGGAARPGVFRKLSRAEYLALSPEEREQYKNKELEAKGSAAGKA